MFAYWRRAEDPLVGRPDWIAIAIFFVVACLWSCGAGLWGGVRLPGGNRAPVIDSGMLVGFGPVMGALVADLIRPMQRAGTVGFLGRSKLWALFALAVPGACLAGFGLRLYHVDPHVDGLTIGLSMAIYCIGEELGWREWLFNALGGLALWRSVLVTWVLWFAWSWTFLWKSLSMPIVGLMFALTLLIGSFALAVVARRTRSSAIAAGWHAMAKSLGSPAQIMMILLLAVVTWASGKRTLRIGRPTDAEA